MAESNRQDMIRAVDLAIAGDWDGAHKIVQADEEDATSCWIHAVLHKIEGDAGNARYWYRRAGQAYRGLRRSQGRACRHQGGANLLRSGLTNPADRPTFRPKTA